MMGVHRDAYDTIHHRLRYPVCADVISGRPRDNQTRFTRLSSRERLSARDVSPGLVPFWLLHLLPVSSGCPSQSLRRRKIFAIFVTFLFLATEAFVTILGMCSLFLFSHRAT